MISRAVILGAVLAAMSLAAAAPVAPAAQVSWRLEQPGPPTPPRGVAPGPFPVPLGTIGGLAFAAPNRGALVTGGNGPVPAGTYAYDGVSWHQLSSVCGAADGSVAWAGPDDLWVVADQRTGQTAINPPDVTRMSLCHLAGGRVVASYAQPLGQPDSYRPMSAAACRGAADCWFGGEPLIAGPPYGAFHARWNGQDMLTVPSAALPVNNDPAHAIVDMAVHQGSYFESVRFGENDTENPAAPDIAGKPAWLHLLSDDLTAPFVPLTPTVDLGRTPSNAVIRPTDLDGFRLSSDGTRLWAVAGATREARANVVVLVLQPSGSFKQLSLTAAPGVNGALPYGSQIVDIAAERGADAVWVAFRAPDTPEDVAQVARVDSSGVVTRVDTVPGPGDGVAPKGTARALACPAPNDCWLTTSLGWLFHLSDGSTHARDTDPSWAGVIDARPADGGTPFELTVEPPVDDSLADAGTALPSSPILPNTPGPDTTAAPRSKTLVSKITSRLRKHTTTLRISFTLATRAKVSVIAKRRGKVVARTKARTIAKGRHTVSLKLNRRRWPTALSVDAKSAAAASGPTAQDAAATIRVPAAARVSVAR